MKHASPLHHDPLRLACAYHPKRPDAHHTQCSCTPRRHGVTWRKLIRSGAADSASVPRHPAVHLVMSNAVATESSLNATILAAGYAAVSIPRAGRLPSDIATLAACDPMTETLRHMGGQARVDAAHAHNIRTPSSPCWRAAELTPNHH